MEKIYSQRELFKLLHIIVRKKDFIKGRVEVVEANQYIQCSLLNLDKGHTFKPHKHIYKEVERVFPQESWCVVEGSVKCIFYDIDNNIIAERDLNSGDASFSLGGGHNYLVLEDNTKVFEYKVGPYLGQEKDKEFI